MKDLIHLLFGIKRTENIIYITANYLRGATDLINVVN